MVEKWAGRLIPLASSLLGASLNYYFVRAWGERAQLHFRQKHIALRGQMGRDQAALPSPQRVLES